MSTKSRKWVLKQAFDGAPKREDFEIVEEDIPPLKDGEFLVEALWLTVDPYMRLYSIPGEKMPGSQVAKVVQSKNKDYNVGDLVCGSFGWQSASVCSGDIPSALIPTVYKVDPSNPPSTALGILGMPGATAYFGLQDICKPLKAGETLVVDAAAGAVGSAVGQIGKIRGMRVVGFAGSDKKVEYLKSIGFDAAFNYKTVSSLEDALKEGCPDGIDVFFDNVGGAIFDAVLPRMNTFGRVSICGFISQYNLKENQKVNPINPLILSKQLRIEGFLVVRWLEQWPAAFKEMSQWIQEGKLQYKELVYEGFDNMYDAFMALFSGDNIGKVVIKY